VNRQDESRHLSAESAELSAEKQIHVLCCYFGGDVECVVYEKFFYG
jgi:hypothetical protein